MIDHPTIPKFSVSADGRIFDKEKQQLRPIRYDDAGYVVTKHKGKTLFAHVMVAETHIPNPENKPFINHKNGRKDDNRVENLEWCTAQENANHKFQVLRYKISSTTKSKMSKAWFKEIGYIPPDSVFDGFWYNNSIFCSLNAIANEIGMSAGAIKKMFLDGKINYVVDGKIQPLNHYQRFQQMLNSIRAEVWAS